MKQLLQNVYEDLNTEELFLINGGYSTTVDFVSARVEVSYESSSSVINPKPIGIIEPIEPYAVPTSEELPGVYTDGPLVHPIPLPDRPSFPVGISGFYGSDGMR